jgi:hypothetical protein
MLRPDAEGDGWCEEARRACFFGHEIMAVGCSAPSKIRTEKAVD